MHLSFLSIFSLYPRHNLQPVGRIEIYEMTSAPCKIEESIAQLEPYYAAYPSSGTFPFSVRPLAQDSALRLAFPGFIDRVTKIISSYGLITLIKSSVEERKVVAIDDIIPAESLCLIVTGDSTYYTQAAREVFDHVLTHMEHHLFNVEILNLEQMQGHLIHGPCLSVIRREVVLEKNLEVLLPVVTSIISSRIGRDLVTMGVYSSVFHRLRIVLSVSVKALATHDWVELRARLADVLPAEVVVMFITLTEAQGANNEMTFL